MSTTTPIKIAVLDLYNGSANMGMDCIMEIIDQWSKNNNVQVKVEIFDVRAQDAIPNEQFDLYISSGGPGSPIDTNEMPWDIAYCKWLDQMLVLNKPVLLICHSFQLACRHFDIGKVWLRKSKQLGILPIHPTVSHPIFNGLADPFFSLESRLYQITEPNDEKIKAMGATIIALEKIRPQLPYERALMGVAFSDAMIGVQFHPEATQERLVNYFESAPIKTTVFEDFSEEKWNQIMLALQDDAKIEHTSNHFIPNFLTQKLLA